ncbi:hypothetical protein DPMN_166746 [Dreissena polymorpha]|uniref:Uncharacterized protein n=1 Tax=Dreissena polymorpha TaxID=45954 RepID=A0A9D4IVR2_DREPO|nr:hypothetical protein DPMN_166746 [Dreissena polymorpha]
MSVVLEKSPSEYEQCHAKMNIIPYAASASAQSGQELPGPRITPRNIFDFIADGLHIAHDQPARFRRLV